MERRDELVRAEDAGWARLGELLGRLSSEQIEEPGLTPDGWSAKDLMWHIGCWSAECARTFEQMRMGTYEGEPDYDTDEVNREWFEVSRGLDIATVKTEWVAARNKMLETFAAFDELTRDADEWFDETGPIHYEKHIEDLERWVDRLTTGG